MAGLKILSAGLVEWTNDFGVSDARFVSVVLLQHLNLPPLIEEE